MQNNMKTYDISQVEGDGYKVALDEKLQPVYRYYAPFARLADAIEGAMRGLPLYDRQMTTETIHDANDALRELADKIATNINIEGHTLITGKQLLANDLGYEQFVDACSQLLPTLKG